MCIICLLSCFSSCFSIPILHELVCTVFALGFSSYLPNYSTVHPVSVLTLHLQRCKLCCHRLLNSENQNNRKIKPSTYVHEQVIANVPGTKTRQNSQTNYQNWRTRKKQKELARCLQTAWMALHVLYFQAVFVLKMLGGCCSRTPLLLFIFLFK